MAKDAGRREPRSPCPRDAPSAGEGPRPGVELASWELLRGGPDHGDGRPTISASTPHWPDTPAASP